MLGYFEEKEYFLRSEEPYQSSLQILNEDLIEQADRVKERIRNHSAGPRAKREGEWQQKRRMGTESTIHPSRNSVLQEESFVHPWAFTPKSTAIRIKTEVKPQSAGNTMEKDTLAGNRMFGRITMHCLRAGRQEAERRAATLESRYKYTLQRIQQSREKRRKEQSQIIRVKQMRKEEREESEILSHISQHFLQEEQKNKKALRERVLVQRIEKQRVVGDLQREKVQAVQQQRLSAYQLKCQKKEMEDYQVYQKRLMCQKQKRCKQECQRARQQCLQNRRMQAKLQFRSRWMAEFQQAAKAERTLTQKQHLFAAKMHQAIQAFAQSSQS